MRLFTSASGDQYRNGPGWGQINDWDDLDDKRRQQYDVPPNQPPEEDKCQAIDDIIGWGRKPLTKHREQEDLHGIQTNRHTQGNDPSWLGWC